MNRAYRSKSFSSLFFLLTNEKTKWEIKKKIWPIQNANLRYDMIIESFAKLCTELFLVKKKKKLQELWTPTPNKSGQVTE
jgi:hypothetical protein